MNMPVAFYLQNWDWVFIYHFLYYTIGGIRHLINNKINEKVILYLPYLIEHKHDIDKEMIIKITNATTDIDYPMNTTGVFPTSIANLYYQIFDCLKDKISVIYSLKDIDPLTINIVSLQNIDTLKTNIVWFAGEHCGCFVPNENPYFLRSLFLPLLPEFSIKPNKRIYITRKNSEFVSRHNGVKKRHVLNEDELIERLTYLDFQYVQLEDLSFKEKVELFATSEMIVAPNGGGLSFLVFANEKTKFIELFPNYRLGEYGQTYEPNYNHRQFLHVANILKLNYTRFPDMTFVDNELNIKVNIDSLLPFIEKKLSE
jgi:hypothetical protein